MSKVTIVGVCKVSVFLVLGYFICVLLTSPQTLKASTDPLTYWSTTATLPYTNSNHTSNIVNGNIYMIGGSVKTGESKYSVMYAPIDDDGNVLEWKNTGVNTPDALIFHATISYLDNIYVLGGKAESSNIGNSVNYVWQGKIDSNSLTSWTSLTALPKRLAKGKAAVVNGKIYFVGGTTWTNSGNPVSSKEVYYTNVNTDGTIGNWTTTSQLPIPLSGHGLIEANGRLTTVGGSSDGSETAINKTFSAQINADGSLGNWIEGPMLPQGVRDGATIKVGSYAIQIGGYGSGYTNKIYYSEINNDGNLGPWNASADFPIAHCCGGVTSDNNKIYITGGYNATGGVSSDSIYIANTIYITPTPTASPTPTPPIPTPTTEPTPTPTPSPTPAPTQNPIIVLPGILASYNHLALWGNVPVANKDWKLCPVYCESYYKGFLEALQSTGYVIDKDLFLYNYDWRKQISENADDLAKFINLTVLPKNPNNTKVTLIGHSLGGLIARDYVQDSHGAITDHLITVGSPNAGSAKLYRVWEGADVQDFTGVTGALLKSYIYKEIPNYVTEVGAVRGSVPSIQNMLPTFTYLKDLSGKEISLKSMKWTNNYLPGMNSSVNEVASKINTINGSDVDTLRWLKVKPADWFDKVISLWPDGKPVNEEKSSGDETVLVTSSGVNGAVDNAYISGVKHSDLMNNMQVQKQVFKILGLSGQYFNEGTLEYDKLLLITVASPVNFEVVNPDGSKILPTDKLIIVPNPSTGSYKVNLTGTGNGEYTLYFGRFNGQDTSWETKPGKVILGQNISYNFDVNLNNVTLGGNPLKQALDRLNYLSLQTDGSNLTWLRKRVIKGQLELVKLGIELLKKTSINQKTKYQVQLQLIYKGIDELTETWQSKIWKDLPQDLENQLIGQLRLVKNDLLQDYNDKFQ